VISFPEYAHLADEALRDGGDKPMLWHTSDMNSKARDGADVWLPPPLVYLGGLVLGIILQAFVAPLDIPNSLSLRAGLTALTALCGAAFLSGAIHLFKKSDQNPKPWRDTPEIVSAGVY
jgi:hypothetical protein